MLGSKCLLFFSLYILFNNVLPLPTPSNTTTAAPDSNVQKIIDSIVKILSIGQPEEEIVNIRVDVTKKVLDKNVTDLSQIFTKQEYNHFCSFWPNGWVIHAYNNRFIKKIFN